MRKNIVASSDGYKWTHWLQYEDELTKMYSYGEPRIGSKFSHVCWFGIQANILDNLMQKVTTEMIDEAEDECGTTFGTTKYFNRKVWEKVRDLGYLPIIIKAAPEGSVVPVNNTLFTIESAPEAPWFAKTANSLETVLMNTWYPTTVATNDMYIKQSIIPYVKQSGSMGALPYMEHDFGMRGVTCYEQGALGGAAHLIWFEGSDTMSANLLIKDYYGMKGRAKSVWATEHSVATSFGPGRGEIEYVLHQLRKSKELGVEHLPLSLVIDSYDTYGFIPNVMGDPEVKQMTIDRPGRIVLRPDSGVPKIVINKCLELARNVYGYSINDKDFKVLNHNVGFLQGDGMKRKTIPELYSSIVHNGWSSDNLIVGSGGGLLQEDMTRDTQRFAIKASYGERTFGDNAPVGFNITKDPKTSDFKKSKPGMLKLHKTAGMYSTLSSAKETPAMFNSYIDHMHVVYEKGELKNEQKFEDIIARAEEEVLFALPNMTVKDEESEVELLSTSKV